MIGYIILAFLGGTLVGTIGMAMINCGSRADERETISLMRNALREVLIWNNSNRIGPFPEKDILNMLEGE